MSRFTYTPDHEKAIRAAVEIMKEKIGSLGNFKSHIPAVNLDKENKAKHLEWCVTILEGMVEENDAY